MCPVGAFGVVNSLYAQGFSSFQGSNLLFFLHANKCMNVCVYTCMVCVCVCVKVVCVQKKVNPIQYSLRVKNAQHPNGQSISRCYCFMN